MSLTKRQKFTEKLEAWAVDNVGLAQISTIAQQVAERNRSLSRWDNFASHMGILARHYARNVHPKPTLPHITPKTTAPLPIYLVIAVLTNISPELAVSLTEVPAKFHRWEYGCRKTDKILRERPQ
jgi:hypothetical protein